MIKPYYTEPGITIYCADCRDVLPQLEPVDLVLTDPPYGLKMDSAMYKQRNTQYGHSLAPKGDYGQSNWDIKPTKLVFDLFLKISKETIVWGGNYFSDYLPVNGMWLVWDKEKDFGELDYSHCELAWTSIPKEGTRIFRYLWNGMIQKDMKNKEIRIHPTQKPLSLMRWSIKKATNPQTILDPFMGSGTTLRAAKDLGRKAIGIEIEQKYCDIAILRLRD